MKQIPRCRNNLSVFTQLSVRRSPLLTLASPVIYYCVAQGYIAGGGGCIQGGLFAGTLANLPLLHSRLVAGMLLRLARLDISY